MRLKQMKHQTKKIDNIYDDSIGYNNNHMKPKDLKRIRKNLKLSKLEAGLIFGGGVTIFEKYENKKLKIPKSIDLIFTLLDKKYITMDTLVKAKQKA